MQGSVSGGASSPRSTRRAAGAARRRAAAADYGISDEQAFAGRASLRRRDRRVRAGGRSLSSSDGVGARRRRAVVFTDLDDGSQRLAFEGEDARADELLRGAHSRVVELEGRKSFANVLGPPPRLLVFGAIDTAEALCAAAKRLGWRTIVADARGRFATRERMPSADELIVAWPEDVLARVQPDHATAVVVLTHDEKFDLPALIGARDRGVLHRRARLAAEPGEAARAAAGGGRLGGGARADPRPGGLDLGGHRRRRPRSRSWRRSSRCAQAAPAARCASRRSEFTPRSTAARPSQAARRGVRCTSAVISSHGVTSKAGFTAAVPSGAIATPFSERPRSAPRSSISISAPVGVAASRVDSERRRRKGPPRGARRGRGEGSDLVGSVAVRGDAVGAGEHDVRGAAREQERRGRSTIEPVRRADALQLPRRQARALQQRPRLEHERLLEPALLVQGLDDGERGAPLDRREAARVADRHRANPRRRRARARARPALAHRCEAAISVVADRERLARASPSKPSRPRGDAVDHPREIHGGGTRAAQRFDGCREVGLRARDTTPKAPATPMRGRAAYGEPLDRSPRAVGTSSIRRTTSSSGRRVWSISCDRAVDPVDRPRHAITIRARWTGPPTDLEQCVQASRRLGADPSLVLHGGGNSSVKTTWRDVTGRDVDAIYVKGTGRDMATIGREGFRAAPARAAARAARARRARRLARWSASSPPHGSTRRARSLPWRRCCTRFLPYPAVLHTHADAIVALTNVAEGEALVREVFGDTVVVIPYVMPGFELAREVRTPLARSRRTTDTAAMVC